MFSRFIKITKTPKPIPNDHVINMLQDIKCGLKTIEKYHSDDDKIQYQYLFFTLSDNISNDIIFAKSNLSAYKLFLNTLNRGQQQGLFRKIIAECLYKLENKDLNAISDMTILLSPDILNARFLQFFQLDKASDISFHYIFKRINRIYDQDLAKIAEFNNQFYHDFIVKLYNFVKQYDQQIIINYCINKFNKHISNINLDVDNIMSSKNKNLKLSNILTLLIISFNHNYKLDKCIDQNYIISSKCTIKWLSPTIVNDVKEYNLTTKYFYLILNAIRIVYIPAMYRSTYWPTTINNLRFTYMQDINQKVKMMTNILEIDKLIVKNQFIHEYIQNYYIGVISWLDNNTNFTLFEDILYSLVYYFSNLKQTFTKITYDESFNNFFINLMLDDNLTKNIHIKLDAIRLFVNIYKLKLLDHVSMDIKLGENLIKSIIIIHNQLHEKNIDPQLKVEEKFYLQQLYLKLSLIFPNIISNVIQNDSNMSYLCKKFINIILMDAISDYTYLQTVYKKKNVTEKYLIGIIDELSFGIKFVNFLVKSAIDCKELRRILNSNEISTTLVIVN